MPSYRSLQVVAPSNDFRQATRVVEIPHVPAPSVGHVIIQNHYVGINATDINIVNGGYGDVSTAGCEGVGLVHAVGDGVSSVQVGDAVAYQKIGSFAEYVEVPSGSLVKIPAVSPEAVSLPVCGVSASVALKVGHLGTNETVFVSAAAGGTGQFVVQLAKLAGNHVIGTCSSDDKATFLTSLGVDRVINYSKEDIGAVLKSEYPNGVDFVFESIGGDVFRTLLDNIAVHARVVCFGSISGYRGGGASVENPMLAQQLNRILLRKSASLHGFYLLNHSSDIPVHTARLLSLIHDEKLKVFIDPTEFTGLEAVADAIDRMYAKKNIGKLVVKLV